MEAVMERPVAIPGGRAKWAGRVISAVPVLFLLFDASIKLADIPAVAEASGRLGLPVSLAVPIAVIELVCLALYLTRRTAVLGAVLLTGFLGGAVAIHARIGDPLFSHTLFPVFVAVFFWGGLFLRDSRVRALIR